MQKLFGFLLAVMTLLIGLGDIAQAQLRIDITKGRVEPMPLAVTDFIGNSVTSGDVGRDLGLVIAADLERSGLFRPIEKAAFIQERVTMNELPRFGDWRILNAQVLIHGAVQMQQDGRMNVVFRAWDVVRQEQLVAKSYNTVRQNWRRIAHIIADLVYTQLTGEAGYFDTRIVYISEAGPPNKRVKRLAIMDQDGENHRFLTDGSSLVLTPRFSPTLQEITYMSYYRGIPRVYIFNIDTGRQELLGDFPGMTFAPRFSPDGNSVIMSMAKNGNSDIYSMELGTRKVVRLTDHSGIDTSPSYSPDGKFITFNSDRGGSQQLYVMDAAGRSVRRISYGNGRYATPVWSPRGDLIAFTKMTGGKFYIGVMRPDGSDERLLADGYLVESPTWAPNGRVLMFFRETPEEKNGGVQTKLFSIDLTGFNERRMFTPLDGSDPAWSPLIPQS